MSVESEILRIQHNIANTYASVAAKGGQVPLQPTSENLAAAVSSIPQTLPPPDNNPVGTVISYMGVTAPKDYLICDGSEYDIADYPKLANHLQEQFGSTNHFGGDGDTTFAVPDMRNLFLRGYHGEAEEQLSGEIGVKQEATQHYNARVDNTAVSILYRHDNFPENADSVQNNSVSRYGNDTVSLGPDNIAIYTSRPVNMTVLYCIKAAESYPAEKVYSTEETRIGTWINGKPIYRRVYAFENVTFNGNNGNAGIPFSIQMDIMDEIVSRCWNGTYTSAGRVFSVGGDDMLCEKTKGIANVFQPLFEGTYMVTGTIILEYTKNDD